MTTIESFIEYAKGKVPALAETFKQLNIRDIVTLELSLANEAATFDDFQRSDYVGGGAPFYPDLPLTDSGVLEVYSNYKTARIKAAQNFQAEAPHQ
jgi:hypothetical protein